MRALGLIVLLCGCAAPRYSGRVLEEAGYADIQPVGYLRASCTDDDDIRGEFLARKDGKTWRVTVCRNVLEHEAVVRFSEE